jgi:plastocyanin
MPEEHQTPPPATVAHEPLPVAEPPVSHIPAHKPYLSSLNPDEWFQPDEVSLTKRPLSLSGLRDRFFSKSLLLSFALAGASVLIIIIGSVSLLHQDKKPEVVVPATPVASQYGPNDDPLYYGSDGIDQTTAGGNTPASSTSTPSTGGNTSSTAPAPAPNPAPTPTPPAAPAPKTYTVGYTNSDGFTPTPLTIKAGDTVIFKNSSNKTIQLSGSGYAGFPSSQSIAAGSSYSFTFTAKGTLIYNAGPNKTSTITIQ